MRLDFYFGRVHISSLPSRQEDPSMFIVRTFPPASARTGGNTGKGGNPLPFSGASDSSTISGASANASVGRLAPRRPAETGGNRRILPAETLLGGPNR